ncbi:MAG TPA: lytic murein transglycosylase [Pseudonocardiaceae bacterium]|nr:lytic murein transglycosylase [Pseudonocardiaceae bacterium]
MSGNTKRPRGARFSRVLLAGVLVAAYGVNSYDVARSAIPPPTPAPDRADHPGPHESADGGLPVHLAAPPGPVAGPSRPPDNGAVYRTADTVSGIPAIVLDAYRRAGQWAAEREPSCHLPWQLLAAIGKVESGHAEQGAVDSAGTALRPILGPALDGTNGYAAIPSGNGASGWARAMGPMQFIPSTWDRWAVDANGDGRADPENVYDATAAAADYLCADGRDLSTQNGLTSAILSYNDSARYLGIVWKWYQVYLVGVAPTPDSPGGQSATEVAVVEPAPPRSTPPPPATPPPTTTSAPPMTPPPTTTAPTPTPQPNPVTGIVDGLTGAIAGTVAGVGGALSGLLGPAGRS